MKGLIERDQAKDIRGVSQLDSIIVEDSQPTFEGEPLPDGWRLVRLEEVVSPRNGYWGQDEAFPLSTEILVLGVGNIANDGTIKLDGAQRRYLSPYEQEAIALEGDLLVVKSSGSATNIRSGKAGLCSPELSGKIACSNFMIRLVVQREEAEPYLLWQILNSSYAKKFIKLIAGSTTYPNIKWENYKNFTFPLPSIPEQKRIAAILKGQTAAVERARAAAEAQLKAAKDLPAAYLREVFDSPEAERWQKKQIGNVAKVQSGYAFKSDWFTSDGIRLLRNANIFQGFISWSDTVRLSMDRRAEFEAYEMAEGDIVLALDRPLVSNGLKVARLTSDDVPALLLQRVGRFQLRDGIDADYLYAFLNSKRFINAITAHDQSLGVPHVSPAQVEAVELPFPSLTEQQRIAKRLYERIRRAGQTTKILKDQLDAINKLPAALLRQAFAGKL